MSERRVRADSLLIGGLLVLALIALVYVMSGRQQVLRSSPAGLDGLRHWLSSEGVEARSSTGGWPIEADSVGLLIVPLYDTDLGARRDWPETKEELLMQQDEYDLNSASLLEKQARVPTLVVLPKWRSGMRLTGLGHPVLLAEGNRVTQLLHATGAGPTSEMVWATQPFTGFAAPQGRRAQIYAAQAFRAPRCTPLVGTDEAMLLGKCISGSNRPRYVLSDPDLINNHGLRLGENAQIVADLLGELADGKAVIIDYSPINWLRDDAAKDTRQRSWTDLLQFFAPPFTALWALLGLLLAMALWRASIRFGPVRDEATQVLSKTQALDGRARLMRLTGQDGAMLQGYGQTRLASVAAQIFGPKLGRRYASEEAFLDYVARRHPAEKEPLSRSLTTLRSLPPTLPAAQAIAQVDEFERILERITNDT